LELAHLELGRYGQRLYELARRIDRSAIVANRVSKSVSAITFWYGGIGAGILAAVLVVLIRTFVFSPETDLISRISYDLVFVLFSFFMAQARRAKSELDVRVAKRTAALSQANEELQLEISERRRAEEALQAHLSAPALVRPVPQSAPFQRKSWLRQRARRVPRY
jgi:phosphoglycerate-specific signal transduction histidine kinase